MLWYACFEDSLCLTKREDAALFTEIGLNSEWRSNASVQPVVENIYSSIVRAIFYFISTTIPRGILYISLYYTHLTVAFYI